MSDIFIDDTGKGYPLVLVHGYLGSSEMWCHQRDYLSNFNILLKTLGFTYFNPHVYSDTVFFLGNFSKNFLLNQKVLFGLGASISSFLFFFLIGYLSKFLSKYAQNQKIWKVINIFIIIFMSFLTFYIFLETI